MDENKTKEPELIDAELVEEADFDPLARWIEIQKWLHGVVEKEA